MESIYISFYPNLLFHGKMILNPVDLLWVPYFQANPYINPQKSLYKIINLSGDDPRSVIISHKNCFVPNIDVLDFVGDLFGVYKFGLDPKME